MEGPKGLPRIPVWSVRHLLARGPSLGLALLHGVRGWEASRLVADVWVTLKGYQPTRSTNLAEVASHLRSVGTCVCQRVMVAQAMGRSWVTPPP